MNRSNAADFKQKEAQKAGNLLLENTLDKIRTEFPEIYITLKPEEDQDDKGIDFQLELIDKSNSKTFDIIKIQNKGTYKPLKPLVQTDNKGRISFQLDVKHARYYRQEIPVTLLFTVCDIKNKKVFWHAMQRDDSIDLRAEEAEKTGQKTIQIYLDPLKVLTPVTFRIFLEDAERSYREQHFRFLAFKNNPINESDNDYEVDHNKPLLDQLFDYMEQVYEEVKYMPVHLLIKNYPFRKSASFKPYYHRYQITTDNDELIKLLASIKIRKDATLEFNDLSLIAGVDNYQEKAAAIFRKLSQNHIFSINSHRHNSSIDVRLFSNTKCPCPACSFSRLDFINTFKQLNTEPESLQDGLRQAYVHYQLGDFMKAARQYEILASLAKKEGKDIIYLITQFSLIKLGRFIRNDYWDGEEEKFGRKLEQLSLDQAMAQVAGKKHHRSLLSWIREQKFIYEPLYHINDKAGKLRNEYQGHIKGDRGTNHNTDELINAYLELHMFVDANYVVYDKFSEYGLLTDAYIEGIFASYAMRHDQGNTLQKVNDFHLKRLIFDGNSKSIWRYFNKYYLQSLEYYSNKDDDRFLLLVKELLLNNHLIRDAYSNSEPEKGGFFRRKYESVFCNTICVASILEMSDRDVSQITSWLIQCLKLGELNSQDCYAQINKFIARKSGQLSLKGLCSLINISLDKPDLDIEKRFEYLTREFYKRKETVLLTLSRSKVFLALAFNSDNDRNFNIAVDFHRVATDDLKSEIVKTITQKLDKKFDSYQYYFAAIYSLVSVNTDYFHLFINTAVPDPERHSVRTVFYGEEDNRYPLLDMLLNLCFKNQINLLEVTNKKFTGFNHYYDWLLNMEGFDYGLFELKWLGLYGTKYYFNEFLKYPIIREKLEQYLALNRDPYLERIYFDLYNPYIGIVES